MQVEASLACNLRCPGCSNGRQIRTRPKPFVLPEQTLAALVRALREERYQVDEVEYCGQGEPLLHPRFPELVDLVRSSLPEARRRVITNGNVDYSAATGRRPLDEIFVSCDGVRQPSYEKYRVRGDVEMALRFMADVPPVLDGVPQTLVWKYILFEFNDSDAEIAEAQRRAQDLGVDQLLFVFTHSAFRSTRWTVANAAEFPMLYPNVTTSATPVHDQRRREGGPGLPWGELRRRGAACRVRGRRRGSRSWRGPAGARLGLASPRRRRAGGVRGRRAGRHRAGRPAPSGRRPGPPGLRRAHRLRLLGHGRARLRRSTRGGAAAAGPALYHRFVQLVEACGPFGYAVSKTTITFKGSRRGFAGARPTARGLVGYLDLQRQVEDPRITTAAPYTKRLVVQHFRVTVADQLDDEFAGWVREAYDVGQGGHLSRS